MILNIYGIKTIDVTHTINKIVTSTDNGKKNNNNKYTFFPSNTILKALNHF